MPAATQWSFYTRLEARCGNSGILRPRMHERPAEEPRATAPLGRIEFETLISDVSAQLIAADPESVEQAIDHALQQVLAFFGADRCGLLGVSDNQQRVIVLYGVYSEGFTGLPGETNIVELFPWATRTLLTERAPVMVRRVADLPPEADRRSRQLEPVRAHPVESGRPDPDRSRRHPHAGDALGAYRVRLP